jgi:hypothetical protein
MHLLPLTLLRRRDRDETSPPSVFDRSSVGLLEKLAILRDRGIISAEEFDRKKAELMDRI